MLRSFAAVLAAALPVFSQSLPEKLDALLASPEAQGVVWGVQVRDLATGDTLYERNAQQPLTPASNNKLVSTSIALSRLGPEFRFQTRIRTAAAPDSTGRVNGDLIFEGGGDPSLSQRIYPYAKKDELDRDPTQVLDELAAQVARAGVRTITGDIVGDDTLYPFEPYPDGWAIGDMMFGYGAPVSALTFNDNSQWLSIRPGAAAGDPASLTLKPAVEFYTLVNLLRAEAGAKRAIALDRQPGSRTIVIHGTAPPGSGAASQTLAVDEPALFASAAFRDALVRQGVTVLGQPRARHRLNGAAYAAPEGTIVAERASPPLPEILTVINKVSQNLHAELVLREATRRDLGDATQRQIQEEIGAFFTELSVPKEWFSLEDGSGLARPDKIAPAALVALLTSWHHSPHRDLFLATLPVGGQDGTLDTRFRGMSGAAAVHAKTGTIRHVAALSGYAGDDPAKRLVFSIIANDFTSSPAAVRGVIDKMAVAVAEAAQ